MTEQHNGEKLGSMYKEVARKWSWYLSEGTEENCEK
jgi:hypothetical protein